ncbi:MAG: type II secretion system F family protein [Armatimonadetes bacterium]|nr:type II secretion system F family protein [Armatimonadota bacterium]
MMGEYVYVARGKDGGVVEGRISAPGTALALGRLKAQGLEVERIRAAGREGSGASQRGAEASPSSSSWTTRAAEQIVFPVASGVPLGHLATFFRQLATLVGAGIPLVQALVSCEAQGHNVRLKAILRDCQAHTMAGGRLSEALERHRYAFTELHLAMLRAAEYGGSLEGTLDRLATYLEQELALRRSISRLTLYPKLVAFSALFILGKSFFSDGMPAISKLIIGSIGRSTYDGVAYFMDTAMVLAIVGAAVVGSLIVGRTLAYRSPAFRLGIERFKLALPGVGGVSRGFALTRFGRAFAAMYAAGLPMSEAIRVAAHASGSFVLRSGAERAVEAVERGEALSAAFARTGVLPPLVLDMMRTGEQTGNLDTMMGKVADHLEGESETRAYQYSHIFATAVYLVVAVLVGFAIVRFWSGYAAGAGG